MSGPNTQACTSVAPSAARLTESLRDIGYEFATAVADLVDNSIAAGAARVDIIIRYDGADSCVFIADDGSGMTSNELIEALRFGSRRTYGQGDLGRYGLGLKTASLSQCRRFSVVTRRSAKRRRIVGKQLDLDRILRSDQWFVVEPAMTDALARAYQFLEEAPGTVVVWEQMDRVLPDQRTSGGWAKRRLDGLAQKTVDHLGMVFHRFIEGLPDGRQVAITLNGEKVAAWNPFAPEEPECVNLPEQHFELTIGEVLGQVQLRRTVLPPRDLFSSPAEFERLSGPLKWNRQQGIYIYRANRLVQWGGWGGLRGIDEHTKLARACLDFDTDLDEAFNINVAKMRVTIPAQLKQMLERPIHELCIRADDTYRKTSKAESRSRSTESRSQAPPSAQFALALRAAAMQAGEYGALERIFTVLRGSAPDEARFLGLDR